VKNIKQRKWPRSHEAIKDMTETNTTKQKAKRKAQLGEREV